jgi:hypothetical protein
MRRAGDSFAIGTFKSIARVPCWRCNVNARKLSDEYLSMAEEDNGVADAHALVKCLVSDLDNTLVIALTIVVSPDLGARTAPR